MTACHQRAQPSKGLETNEKMSGIVGGNPMLDGYLNTLGVVMLLDTESGNLCSGTLIAKKTLLTAAHCIPKDYRNLEVFFDANPFSEMSDVSAHSVETAHIHPKYLFSTDEASVDLALVILKVDAPKFLNLAQVPQGTELQKQADVTLYGYGKLTAQDENSAGVLRSTTMKISEVQNGFFKVDQSSGKGICDGDSGGPALIANRSGWALVGVSKMDSDIKGEGAAACAGMGQFTEVHPHLEWITKHLVD